MKKILYILLSIFLFAFETSFIYTAVNLLQKIGIDYYSFTQNGKIIFTITIYLIIMLIFYLIYRKNINHALIDYAKNFKKYFNSAVKIWAISLLIMIISNLIIISFVGSSSTNESIVQETIQKFPLYMLFSTIIYAPFTEEIIFRKSLRNIFDNKYAYIIMSGLTFGFAHLISGINNPYELLFIIPYGVMGSAFAYIYTKTNNITVPISIHMLHNTITVTMSLLALYLGG